MPIIIITVIIILIIIIVGNTIVCVNNLCDDKYLYNDHWNL